jgi:hypothetical protein
MVQCSLRDCAPADAVQLKLTWALAGVAIRPVGAAGAEGYGVAEVSVELPLSPPLFTAVTT